MPQLNWNEYEFIECLEVLPAVEYSVQHRFVVQRGGIELVVTVWQLESIVQLSLREADQQLPLIEFVLVVRDRVGISKVRMRRSAWSSWRCFSRRSEAPIPTTRVTTGTIRPSLPGSERFDCL